MQGVGSFCTPQKIRQMFKSQNKFVIEAVNDYYNRRMAAEYDPYLETREKEDAFAERIVEAVEKKVMSNLPALLVCIWHRCSFFLYPFLWGAYQAAQGGMVCGQESLNGADSGNVTGGTVSPLLRKQRYGMRGICRKKLYQRMPQSRRTMI